MRLALLTLFAIALVSFGLTPAPAQERKREALVDQVKNSIDRGVAYLRAKQVQSDGGWEVNLALAPSMQGGSTALAVLALLNAGVPVDDPAVANGLKYLRSLQATSTYVRALQTMVFVEAGQTDDLERIQKNVDWLVKNRVFKNGQFIGWSYDARTTVTTDNSNNQYAVLGLWFGRQSGASVKKEIWEAIRNFYIANQESDGGWPYGTTARDGRGSTLTMTTAGVCGLLVAAMELNSGREVLKKDGTATNCGVYPEDKYIQQGLSWISSPVRDRFQLDLPQRIFYNMYGIERTGRLSGQRFIGAHDWYREGCKYLVEIQQGEGSWRERGMWDNWPTVSTSFALLFLSKGRTPVLVSKLVHGTRLPGDDDWNNDRNDLRHLTEFSSKELFKRLPLAWQTFDVLRAAQGPEDVDETTSELLASPIVYFNGHKSPHLRFTKLEQKILQNYIENGGFILAEACCGSPEFDAGFKKLVKELWPDQTLDYLDAEHPVWGSFFKLERGKVSKLMGLQMGCKTVLIYSPQDLSCRWESNDLKDGNVLEAFKLGANIVAYVTGLEPPKPRLTHIEVASAKDPASIPRGYYKVGQLKYPGDFKPAPRAMPNLMNKMRSFAGLDVVLKTEEITVFQPKLVDYKFIYMHGRGDFKFNRGNPRDLKDDPGDLEYLRFNLENGGMLFADACCGKEAFDKAFRKFVTDLFPPEAPQYKNAKLEQIPLDDELFSKDLNGEAITERNIKCRRDKGGQMRNVPPFLEGVKINNRWVIIYSKYDIGCALERHQSSDCLGYDVDGAFRLAGAAVLYTLRP